MAGLRQCHPQLARPRPAIERGRTRPRLAKLDTKLERPLMADAVEKFAARRFQPAGEKIDLSHRPTNRSRTWVKGKTTPENLVRRTVNDFFQQHRPVAVRPRSRDVPPGDRSASGSSPPLLQPKASRRLRPLEVATQSRTPRSALRLGDRGQRALYFPPNLDSLGH
jgi:hypothetical protein